MGIQGLLKAMKPYINPVHVKKYAGRRVGIDAYSWLHKGAYSCSMEICQNKFNDSDPKLPYLQYCMHRINMLRYHNVIPVVVFDGGRLPSKALTVEDRQRKRTENLEQAQARLTEGNVKAAIESFQRAVEITPFMAYQLIRILKSEGVEFIVAPYEADAQLAYLARLPSEKGGIEAVISEDSDLMAYGCNVIIYKMDRTGDGEEVEMDQVLKGHRKSPDMISFKNFTQEMFTGMCVLAGCDFLSSVHGIGVKRAHALVSKYRNLDRVISVLRMDKNLCVPEGYSDSFREACAIFHHARVYDHNMKCLSFLSSLPEASTQIFEGNLDFLGPELPKSMVIAIAEGKLDPVTMEAFNNQSYSQRERTSLPSGIRSENVREQPRAVQTAKESSPFVFISQTLNEDLFVLPENKAETQLSSRHKEVARAVEDPHVCSVPAERITSAAERKRGSGSVSVSDSALNAHFRSILEESASRSTRGASQFQKENEDLKSSTVCTLDIRGQKRVFPIPPSNNPFKKQKRDTSASLTPNFNTEGLEQKGASEMEPKTVISECRTHEKTDEQPLSDMSINRSSLLLTTIKEMGCSNNGPESPPPDPESSSASRDLSSAPAPKSLQASHDLSSKLLHKVLSTPTANEHHKKRKTGIFKFFNKATRFS